MLRTLGVGALAATAGCLFGSGTDSGTTDQTPTNGERASRTTTQEQSIPTTAPAATATGAPASTTRTEQLTTNSTAEPTATRTPDPASTTARPTEPTPTATRTSEPTSTPTQTADPTTGWTEQAPLPVVGSDAGGGVLDGKLHFFGGIETDVGLDAVARTFAYDPAGDSGGSWERLPDLPRNLWGPCGVATENTLYSFGGAPTDGPYEGDPPSDGIVRYRPDEGWTELSVRCPYPNWVMGGVYNPDDGLIYCVGGGTGAHDAATATDHGFEDENVPGTYDESRLWTFDPEAERVVESDLARMPEAKRWPTVALFSVDGTRYLHAIGGLSGTTGPTDSNFRYDFDTENWERAQSLPRPGTYATHSNPVIDGQAYLTHGMFWEGESTIERYKPTAHRYDPASDEFATDLPAPDHLRGGATSGVIDGTLYVVGGHIKRFEQDGLHDCVAHNEAYRPVR